jgi:YebC/PmpR family DNA-binding regulatory protein
MSGHSKWAQIKRQKGVQDTKRGTLFTKLSNAISLMAKAGGKDPETNFKLRLAIEKARSANMPMDNIERAIKKGVGELDGQQIEEVAYEGYGPGGIAIIIEAVTDNKNRTTSEIRNILSKYGGRLGEANSVKWLFGQKGVIKVLLDENQSKEWLELKIIDAGAEDVVDNEDELTIFTKPSDLEKVKKNIEKQKIQVEYAEIELVAKNKVEVSDSETKNKLEKIFEELDNHDNVDNFFTNLKE